MTMRVLLVEDDAELRRTLRDALTLEGYEMLTAASLSEGLALAANAALDLLRTRAATGKVVVRIA